MFRLYKARLKCLIRSKENIFWSYIFPIVLVTLYYFGFTNLFTVSDLKTIDIAYVQNVQETNIAPLRAVLDTAEISEGLPLFNVINANIEEAEKALEDDRIIAYIVNGEEANLYVKRSGMNETIVKSFLDSYNRAAYTIQSILIQQPEALSNGLLDDVMENKSFTTEIKSGVKPDVLLIYYYALLAFCCLFAANWGLDEVVNIQGNRSSRGARINVSPIHKMKLLLINLMAAFTVHAGSVILMILYMLKVLGISFGNHLPQMILACLIGSIMGLLIGATVGVWVNKSTGVQSAIITLIVMFGAFLSGMMFVDMKYIIAKNAPILSYINPVNLLSDSFYSLYYYETFDRFYLNISILLFMTVVLGVASYLGLRRKTYASI